MLGINEIAVSYGKSTSTNTHPIFWGILDTHERAQAEKFKTPLLRQRYIEVHGQLRLLLAKTLNQPAAQLRIARTAQGKPYLPDYPTLAFNLSHSAEHWVIALSRHCQLGIDLEVCQARVNLLGLVERCFAAEEIGYWQQLPETEKNLAFYRYWTRKEAFVKATGVGITLGLNQCAINPQQPNTFLSVPSQYGPTQAWRIHDIELGTGLCCALVTDKPSSVIAINTTSHEW